MQITELIKLTDWFKENIEQTQIPNKYVSLYNKMNQNIRRYSGNSHQLVPFEVEKNDLFNSIKDINCEVLSLEQIQFLEKLGVVSLIGEDGIKQIEDILFQNNLDIATATSKVKELSDTMNNALSIISELATTLKKSFSIQDTDEVGEGSILMRVYFKEKVAIDNLTSFKKFAVLWHEIGRGIAMAHDKSPEDFKIIGAEKGSIIIEMVVLVGIATSVSKILLEALKVTDRVLDIRKKLEEIKSLKLSNKKIEQDIQKEAEKEKEGGIQTILEEMKKDLKLDTQAQGEKIVAIEKSIKDLIEFTENGGIVDFVQPKEAKTNSDETVRKENAKLNKNIAEIRAIENKPKMIES